MDKFPQNFLWGAATSAHQVEGNNLNSDWWHWEQKGQGMEPSGEACRHYELFREDFALAGELSHNAHRFSIEWSRIEPEEGVFDEKEITHYKEVILTLKKLNIEPIVTLHHFTNPHWFTKGIGWHDKRAPDYFLRYVTKVVGALAEFVQYWVTINEPMVYVYHAYVLGVWPPHQKSFSQVNPVKYILSSAHEKAYRFIHGIYKDRKLDRPLIKFPQAKAPQVSIAKNVQYFQGCGSGVRNNLAAFLRNRAFNLDFMNILARRQTLDFIGLNYYARGLAHAYGWRMENLLSDTCKENHSLSKKNYLGWDIYPEGLYRLLMRFNKYSLPILILENGVCTDDDTQRWDFIYEHLKCLAGAIEAGVDVRGYFYWSLLDNFEWDKGFGPRFGLIDVDYRTYERKIRDSARKFAQVCKNGVLR